MVKYFTLYYLFFIFISCGSNEEMRSMNSIDEPFDSLVHKAIDLGDKDAYADLSNYYLDMPTGTFLPIASRMANKHQYPLAFIDVYYALIESESMTPADKLGKCAFRKRIIAIFYLNFAAKLKEQQSIEILNEYRKKNEKIDEYIFEFNTHSKMYLDYLDSLIVIINETEDTKI